MSRSENPEGAKLKTGGRRLTDGDYQHGWFMEPTVFTDVDPKMRIAQEEIFGPVVSILACEDLEDAIAIANGIEYGLSSSLYTKDVNKAFAAMRDLEAGITYINAPTIGAEVHLPFGGSRPPATDIARAASARSTSTPSGRRFTWIIRTPCRRRRSTARVNVGRVLIVRWSDPSPANSRFEVVAKSHFEDL